MEVEAIQKAAVAPVPTGISKKKKKRKPIIELELSQFDRSTHRMDRSSNADIASIVGDRNASTL